MEPQEVCSSSCESALECNMGIILDKTARIPSLEDGKQYQFLGVLESVMQHYELVLECAAKEYLRQMSVVWTNAMLYLPHEKGVDVYDR